MTPQQHLERAEQLLDAAREQGDVWETSATLTTVLESVAHSCIAIGDLLGAPHSGPAPGAASATPG